MYKRLVLFTAISSACASASPAVAESGARAASYWFELVDANGTRLPTYNRDGRTYVLGEAPDRYQVRVHNDSATRVEAVISLDGRDAIDGKNADTDKRGYIIEPYSDGTIDGFRLNQATVATFRFSSVANSYAAQMGNARNVGVIGVAIYPERVAQPVYIRPTRSYAPRYEEDRLLGTITNGAPAAAPPVVSSRGAAALAESQAPSRARKQRAGLGTEFGEARASYTSTVQFHRARRQPDYVLTIRYNDRAGLTALGILPVRDDEDAELRRREDAQPFAQTRYASPPPGWQP